MNNLKLTYDKNKSILKSKKNILNNLDILNRSLIKLNLKLKNNNSDKEITKENAYSYYGNYQIDTISI